MKNQTFEKTRNPESPKHFCNGQSTFITASRPTLKRVLFALTAGILFTATSCYRAQDRYILSVTDIHFNPFYDSLAVQQLIQTPYTQWDSVFSQIKAPQVAQYNEETSPELFELLLEALGKHTEKVAALVFTGDVLAHHFNDTFYVYSGIHHEKAKDHFIYKTMGYISMKLRQTFPEIPIYFSLGNNDSYRGDYAIVDNGNFLHQTAKLFLKNFIDPKADTLSPETGDDTFHATYATHGYYSLKLPTIQNGRIIGLNTIFFSEKYSDTSLAHSPGEKELAWLEAQLSASEKAGENVWLLLHIPPGANVYTTQHQSGQQAPEVSLFWQASFNQQYLALVQRYHQTIVASFAGHTHMDDFRLIYNQDSTHKTPLDFIHITPSVSPVFGNNPAYQIMKVEESTGNLTETTTYYVDLNEAQPAFKEEYQYTSTYHVSTSLSGLDSLYRMMPWQSEMLEHYTEFYPSRSPEAGIANDWQWYWCGIGNLTSEDYLHAFAQLETKQ